MTQPGGPTFEEARQAWKAIYGTSPTDLLSAVRDELLKRGWEMHIEMGKETVAFVQRDGETNLKGVIGTDVTAVAAQAFLDAYQQERRIGMPLFPRPGASLISSRMLSLPDSIWKVDKAQEVFDLLADAYGFKQLTVTHTSSRVIAEYARDGYTLALTARPESDRAHLVLEGHVTRLFSPPLLLPHDIPVHQYVEQAHKNVNRQYRDYASTFVEDLRKALNYLGLVTDDGWSYGEVTQINRQKSYGVISNRQSDHIHFWLTKTRNGWVPSERDVVRFRCSNVLRQEQGQKAHRSPYRAHDVHQVHELVEVTPFLPYTLGAPRDT